MSLNWALLEVGVGIALRGNLNFSWCLVAVGETWEAHMSSDQNPSCLLYMQLYSDYDKPWANYSDLNRRVVMLICMIQSTRDFWIEVTLEGFHSWEDPVSAKEMEGQEVRSPSRCEHSAGSFWYNWSSAQSWSRIDSSFKTDTKPPKETSVLLPVRCILNVWFVRVSS